MSELLRMERITKIYDNGIVANNKVNFSLNKGEIHAIAGENGAGKSTIMKILYGLERPTGGDIYLEDKKVVINSPLDAMKHNIGMVHQHFMLVDNLSVCENIFLGREIMRNHLLDIKEMRKMTNEYAQKYKMDIDPDAICGSLPVSVKQKVEILKVLVRGAKIIILDEPTAVLTPQETQEFFHQLQLLRDDGCTIIIITHKLNEIKDICDRVTIMRHGKDYGIFNVKDIEIEELSRLMVGSDVELKVQKAPSKPAERILSVNNLSVYNHAHKPSVNQVSFDLFAGEILCLAGVEGNGQQDTVQCITGLNKDYEGDILMAQTNIRSLSIKEIRKMGLAHIPEDRMTVGVNLEESILDNLIALKTDYEEHARYGIINYRKLKKEAIEALKNYKVECNSINQPIKMLSGGNMQKVVIARELESNPLLLVADQPTRGVDVGAIEFIHRKLVELRDQGKGILLISADLNEVFNLADRIIVFYNGKITAMINDVKHLSEEELGYYMLGIKTMAVSGCHNE